jgi:hypothetical protein
MEAWAYQYSVQLDFIRPGKPVENSYIESYMDPARVQENSVDLNGTRLQSYIRPV